MTTSVIAAASKYIPNLYTEYTHIQRRKHHQKDFPEFLIRLYFFLGQQLLIVELDSLSFPEVVATLVYFTYFLQEYEVPEVLHHEYDIVKHRDQHEIH